MNWIILIMERDYGKREWHIKSDEEHVSIVAAFLESYFGAIDFLNKKRNEYEKMDKNRR